MQPSPLLTQLLDKRWKSAPVLIQGDTVWTGHDLNERVQAIAGWLKQLADVKSGQTVAMVLGNQIEFIPVLLAIRLLGAIPVPVNLLWPTEDMAYVLSHAEVVAVVTDEHFETIARDASQHACHQPKVMSLAQWRNQTEETVSQCSIPIIDPDDMALLLYTSGTTAKPKGVMLTEANLLANMAGIAGTEMIQPKDRLLMALPLFHGYGLTITLYALGEGFPVVLEPNFRPRPLMDALIRNKVTVLPLVPSMFRLLKEAFTRHPIGAMRVLQTLRCCISGGASLPPVVLEKMADKGVTILEGYGLTEASPVVAVNRRDRGAVAGSVGLPLFNVSVRIRNTETGELYGPVDTQTATESTPVGELEVYGPNVMRGYFKDTEATAAVMTDDGWLKTGDLGHIMPDGWVYLSHGRQKELIIKAGENIAPIRVEALLLGHNNIAEACVFGAPDERNGEKVVACVVVNPTKATNEDVIAELRQWSRKQLPVLMQPDEWTVMPTLPKNAVGKILRRQLQQQWLEKHGIIAISTDALPSHGDLVSIVVE